MPEHIFQYYLLNSCKDYQINLVKCSKCNSVKLVLTRFTKNGPQADDIQLTGSKYCTSDSKAIFHHPV